VVVRKSDPDLFNCGLPHPIIFVLQSQVPYLRRLPLFFQSCSVLMFRTFLCPETFFSLQFCSFQFYVRGRRDPRIHHGAFELRKHSGQAEIPRFPMPRTRNYSRRRKASAEQMVDHNYKGYGVYFLQRNCR
jgi:hypothetical protein